MRVSTNSCAEPNFEEAKSKAKQLYFDYPTEYYVFDYAPQTKHPISVEELKGSEQEFVEPQ